MERLKSLLNDKWRISGYHISFNNITSEEIASITMEKGREKQEIVGKNDDQLMDYVIHLKKFQDQYGNNHFIYVDDLDKYNKKEVELSIKGAVPKRPYRIFLGDRELLDVFLYHLLVPGPGIPVGVAHFFVNLERNPDFYSYDLRDEISIIWADTDEKAFGGFVHESSYSQISAAFLCYGGTRRFNQEFLTSEFLGMKPEDIIYFLTAQGGIPIHFHGGLSANLVNRVFKVIFPIPRLEFSCDFSVNDVVFSPNLQNHLSSQAKTGNSLKKPEWTYPKSYAVVTLNSTHYFDALINAQKKVHAAVDWIQLRTDLTLPIIKYEMNEYKLYYNLQKNYSRFSVIDYGLVMEVATGSSLFSLIDVQVGHPLIIKENPENFLDPLIPFINKLKELSSENDRNSFYQTLHWLMLSYEKESLIDNLLQLWIAFEFLSSKEKVPKIIQDYNIKKASSYINKTGINKKEKELIIRAIHEINEPPLMIKWNHLLSRLNITLTPLEIGAIAKLRSSRNDVIHGKGRISLTIVDIEKFRSILEKVFLIKLSNY